MVETNYQCDQCGKYKKPDVSLIGLGDFVSFGVARQTSSRSIKISTKEGEVIQASPEMLQLKVKRGGTHNVRRSQVTPAGAPSPLTYALSGTCACGVTR